MMFVRCDNEACKKESLCWLHETIFLSPEGQKIAIPGYPPEWISLLKEGSDAIQTVCSMDCRNELLGEHLDDSKDT